MIIYDRICLCKKLLLRIFARFIPFFIQKAFEAVDMEIWWTYTEIKVNSTAIDVSWTWGVVLAVDTPTGLNLHKEDLDFMVGMRRENGLLSSLMFKGFKSKNNVY
jgi:hypothetical protein